MGLAKSFLSLAALEHFLKHGRLILVNKDFPDDARIRQATIDAERGGVWLVVEAASLPDNKEGDLLSDLPITITLMQYQEDVAAVALPSRTESMVPREG